MILNKNLKKLVIDRSLLRGSKFIFCNNIEQAFEILKELTNFDSYIKHGVLIIFVNNITKESIVLHKDFAKYRELFINKNLYFISNNHIFYELAQPIIYFMVEKHEYLVTYNYLKNEWDNFEDTSILSKLAELETYSELLNI